MSSARVVEFAAHQCRCVAMRGGRLAEHRDPTPRAPSHLARELARAARVFQGGAMDGNAWTTIGICVAIVIVFVLHARRSQRPKR